MGQPEIVWVATSLVLFALGPPTAIAADADIPLRTVVRQQKQVIEQFQKELERVRENQMRDQDRVRALEDKLNQRSAGGVDANDVDRRIEAYGTSDENRLFLSGFGTAEFINPENRPSDFVAKFNPIFHFRMTEQLHFNAELEIEIEGAPPVHEHGVGAGTELAMEFATIDYLATDWLTLTAGKFILPFNVFGQKQHPQWINKMVSMPPIYRMEGSLSGIIPILSDIGVMASGGFPLCRGNAKLNYGVYVSNGWGEEADGSFLFGPAPDVNNNKAVGGRVGVLPLPNLEIGASWQSGRTDGSRDRYRLSGFDFWHRIKGLEMRGEYIRLAYAGGNSAADKWGYYVQIAYRARDLNRYPKGWVGMKQLGRFEPVLRWGQVLAASLSNRKQLGLGLNYWLYESVPVKFTYEFNRGMVRKDRLLLAISFGF